MEPNPPTNPPPITRSVMFSVFFLGLAGQLAWGVENQYYNVFLYNYIAPEPLYVSLIVSASAIASTLTTIFIGALSDKKGKRKIFFMVGFGFWPILTILFPFASYFGGVELQVAMAVIFDCAMTFFGAMATDAALNAYITDTTTPENRGKLSSILELVTLMAILVVYGGSGFIIEAWGYFAFFYIIGAFTALLGWVGIAFVKEPALKPVDRPYLEIIRSTFDRTELVKNKDFFYVMLGCMMWAIGFNVFFPYTIIYLQHSLKFDLIMSSILIFVALMSAILGAIPVGKLVDKAGRKKLSIGAVLLETVSLFLFSFARTPLTVAITAIGWLLGMMTFDISTRTWYKDLSPEEKRGQFNGYFILFTVLIGMSVGPFIGGLLASSYGEPIVIDNMPGYIPPSMLFSVAAVLILLSLIPILKAKELK